MLLAYLLIDWFADDEIGYCPDGGSVVARSDAVCAMAAALVGVEGGAEPVAAISAELARLPLSVWACERVGERTIGGPELVAMVQREAPEWLEEG